MPWCFKGIYLMLPQTFIGMIQTKDYFKDSNMHNMRLEMD